MGIGSNNSCELVGASPSFLPFLRHGLFSLLPLSHLSLSFADRNMAADTNNQYSFGFSQGPGQRERQKFGGKFRTEDGQMMQIIQGKDARERKGKEALI